MTVEEFVHMLLLVLCLLAGCVVLPVGMITGSMADSVEAADGVTRPVFVFEDLSP